MTAPPPAERVLFSSRPAPASIAAGPLWFWILLTAAAGTGALTHAQWGSADALWPLLAGSLVAMAAARFAWELAVWATTRYEATTTRVRASWGVLTKASIEIPTHKIQSVRTARRLRDRILGIGSVGISSAGVGDGSGIEVWWIAIADPNAAADLARSLASHPTPTPTPTPTPRRPLVLGLTGSIGSGKSTAAAMFRDLGCQVLDSDAEAREALDRPEVRDTLVGWWSPSILTPENRIDRAKVAAIVFEEPQERARLERLVHPLVRKSRAQMVERAAGLPGIAGEVIVADVPLLFEAGIDRECDMTLFIDAPRDTRARRVAARGWSEEELSRREAAQWPIDQKRARADERIDNAGTLDDLRAAVAAVLARARSRPRRPGP